MSTCARPTSRPDFGVVGSLDEVLEFWFGRTALCDREYRQRLQRWFSADEVLDRQIGERFSQRVERAAHGNFDDAVTTAPRVLALVVLLDQFPRNIDRGTADAYVHDTLARSWCRWAIERGLDRQLPPPLRSFLYMPLQHSEDIADQRRSVELFDAIATEVPAGHWYAPHAEHAQNMARLHERIIVRYGRFPHRNAVLGRQCTLAERMYLDAGGADFGQRRATAEPTGHTSRQFAILRPSLDPAQTVCVDGRADWLRCLSHWPGTEPPPALRHDVSTGMALRWAHLSPDERVAQLGPFRVVTNDHYDSDGVLAAFALVRPQQALEHEELMVRAALTGDFRTYNGEDALAVDLTIASWFGSPRSPVASALASARDYQAKSEVCYQHALAHLGDVLADPFKHRDLWSERFEQIMSDLARVDDARVSVERHPQLDLAVVWSAEPLTRMGLVHAAAEQHRVLLAMPGADGIHYRFLYRNESWFLGVRDRVSSRVALEPVVAGLNAREARSGSSWWCTGLDQTSPQMGLGDPSAAANVFGDLRPDLDPPSSLSHSTVVEHLATRFGDMTP